ncbi:MAG: flagellar basal body-associated FliL family protein [Candidatus Puniceispirillaceae bacterium]
MAETKDSAAQIQENTPLSRRAKILLGAGLFCVIAGIAGLFFYGITHLTAPAPFSNSTLQERLEAARLDPKMLENSSDNVTEDTAEAGLADDADPSGAMEDLDGDGVMDFNGPDYRYYAFETPFVSNLDNSKKLITLELSLLIKRPAFFVDSALEDLMKLSPAMRSRILEYLVTLSPDVLKTRADREALAENIRHLLNDYLKADESNEEEGILAVQILKLVVA